MSKWLSVAACLVFLSGAAVGEEYRVEALDAAPPDGLAPEIAEQIGTRGFKVIAGENRTVCEVWPARQWAVKAGFTPTPMVLYGLEPGSLVGVLRLPRKGADFRNQDVGRGLYTLRYANQPVDGNHVGTFATRDFLVMVPAADDTSPAPIADADLFPKSAESAGSTHPAIMPLVKPDGGGEMPAMRHLEEQDWWTVQFAGQGPDGKPAVLELIVAGKAAE